MVVFRLRNLLDGLGSLTEIEYVSISPTTGNVDALAGMFRLRHLELDYYQNTPVTGWPLVTIGGRTFNRASPRGQYYAQNDVHACASVTCDAPMVCNRGMCTCDSSCTRDRIALLEFKRSLAITTPLPEEMDTARGRYPELSLALGEPLGVHEKLGEIVCERVDAALTKNSWS